MARDEQVHYGAGGKALRRSRFERVRSGPCDRPLSGRHAPPELRAAAGRRRESWFSKIVGSPARRLKDSASWFVSSLFRKSLPAVGSAPEDDSEANEINDIQENEEPEPEELHQEEERNETIEITRVTHPRPGIYNERQRSNLDGFHGQDPAYNFQTSKLPNDSGASPAEIAKAYMGGQSQRAPNCLGFQKKPLLNENTPERSLGISAVRRGPLLIGRGQKFDSSGSNFSRTPHERSVKKRFQNYPVIVPANPLSSIRTPLNTPVQVESEAKNSLKRRSSVLLEDGITSTRKIRQKLHNQNSENTSRTPKDESQIFARVTCVPSQSSEMARRILETLEKMVPSPKDNLVISLDKPPLKLTSNMLKGPALRSMESLAALPFEEQMIHSAEKLEQSNIQADLPFEQQMIHSGEKLEQSNIQAALPFEQQMIHSAESPKQSNIQDIIDKNKSKGKAPLNISDGCAKGGANEYTVHVSEKKRGFQIRALKEDSNDEGNGIHASEKKRCSQMRAPKNSNDEGNGIHVAEKKRGFQMRVPEDSSDDEGDDEGNGNQTGSLSRSAMPAAIPSFNASVHSTHRKDCEQAKLDIPHFGVSKSVAVSKSLPLSTSDPKSLIQSGNESGSQSTSSSFSFPVIPASTITEPPPTPKLESLGTLSTMKAKRKRLSAVRVAAALRSLQQRQLLQMPPLNRKLLRHSHRQLLPRREINVRSLHSLMAFRLSLSTLEQSSILLRKIQRLVNQLQVNSKQK